MSELGKKIWVFPDAYLPAKGNPYKTSSSGDQFSHESLCIVNYALKDANLIIDTGAQNIDQSVSKLLDYVSLNFKS